MSNLLLFILIPAIIAIQVHNHVGFIKFSVPVPEFLSSLSLKAQYDYKVILENETIPLNNRTIAFRNWATNYNVTTQYNSYETEKNTTKIEFNRNVTQVISQLSLVNTQIAKILDNTILSLQEQREAVEELSEQQFSQEVAAVIYVRRLVDSQDVLSKKSV